MIFQFPMDQIKKILDFWFQGLNDDSRLDRRSVILKRWFSKNDRFDAEIRENFEKDVLDAVEGKWQHLQTTLTGKLALILLFDQFSRNIYRNTPRMFAFDPLALSLTLETIRSEEERMLPLIQRLFFYMPLMHAEDVDVQKLSVQCFQGLVIESKKFHVINTDYYEYTLGFARRHHDIIEKFQRFPHRNTILNRISTTEELKFLKSPGARF